MQFHLRTLFLVIAIIAVACAIGRFIGLKGSLAFLCVSGFVVPALVEKAWMRAAVAFGLTGTAMFTAYVYVILPKIDDKRNLFWEHLHEPVLMLLGLGVAAFAFSSIVRWRVRLTIDV